MRYKQTVLGMSEQFLYVHLKLTPKSVSLAAPIGNPHEIVVEVPRGLLNHRQSNLVGQDFKEKAIALDLARDVALKTATPFPAIGERAAGRYDEDRPILGKRSGILFAAKSGRFRNTLNFWPKGVLGVTKEVVGIHLLLT